VDIDNYALGRQLTEYLIARGLRRIALINGDDESAFAAFRAAGYRDALEAAGIAPTPAWSGRSE